MEFHYRPLFDKVRASLRATPQRLKEIVDRHCPVLDDLRSPVAVSLRLQVDDSGA